jgi:hypothetical protein
LNCNEGFNNVVFLKGFLHDGEEPSKLLGSCAAAKAILRLNGEEIPEEKTNEKSHTN